MGESFVLKKMISFAMGIECSFYIMDKLNEGEDK